VDSQGKQRLTGAIILVALFVLLVPELLTGPREAHPPASDGSEAGLRQYTIDLDAQGRAASKPAAQDSAGVALPPVAPLNTAPELAQSGEPAAPETAPAQPANPMAPPASANNAADARPAPAAQVPAVTAPPAATPPRLERGTFVVQLGSFGQKDNADRLVREMTAKGFAAFISPITTNGRELYRVRVGPVRDRASAEALATQLKKVGQSGTVQSIS
jgi:DedD protein